MRGFSEARWPRTPSLQARRPRIASPLRYLPHRPRLRPPRRPPTGLAGPASLGGGRGGGRLRGRLHPSEILWRHLVDVLPDGYFYGWPVLHLHVRQHVGSTELPFVHVANWVVWRPSHPRRRAHAHGSPNSSSTAVPPEHWRSGKHACNDPILRLRPIFAANPSLQRPPTAPQQPFHSTAQPRGPGDWHRAPQPQRLAHYRGMRSRTHNRNPT